jgi:hypothetical protein
MKYQRRVLGNSGAVHKNPMSTVAKKSIVNTNTAQAERDKKRPTRRSTNEKQVPAVARDTPSSIRSRHKVVTTDNIELTTGTLGPQAARTNSSPAIQSPATVVHVPMASRTTTCLATARIIHIIPSNRATQWSGTFVYRGPEKVPDPFSSFLSFHIAYGLGESPYSTRR